MGLERGVLYGGLKRSPARTDSWLQFHPQGLVDCVILVVWAPIIKQHMYLRGYHYFLDILEEAQNYGSGGWQHAKLCTAYTLGCCMGLEGGCCMGLGGGGRCCMGLEGGFCMGLEGGAVVWGLKGGVVWGLKGGVLYGA